WAPVAVLMNDDCYFFFFDAELLRLGRSVTAKLLLFSFEFFLSRGVNSVFLLHLADKPHYPCLVVLLLLLTIALIHAHHFAKEFAFGTALRLRDALDLAGDSRGNGKANSFG